MSVGNAAQTVSVAIGGARGQASDPLSLIAPTGSNATCDPARLHGIPGS